MWQVRVYEGHSLPVASGMHGGVKRGLSMELCWGEKSAKTAAFPNHHDARSEWFCIFTSL